jgi:hypothetical protein
VKIKTTSLSRRTVLRGAGGVAIALPFLEAMRPARALAAATPPPPKRFLVFFSPNGTIPNAWRPTGSETSFTLPTILAPLEPHKGDIIVIQGVDQQGGGGDGHQNGMGGMLTGTTMNPGPFKGGDGSTAGWAAGISVDQRIANEIGKTTKFKSLELGVQCGGADNWGRMSYAGSDQPIPPEVSPYAAFTRIFADLNADPQGLAKLQAQRKTILDSVMGQFTTVKSKLGAEDGRKLDAHLTAVHDIEMRLGTGAAGTSCIKPTPGATIDVRANDNFPAVGKLQMDLLVMALACDLTRVGSIQWNRSVGGARFTWLDIAEGHHALSHEGDSNLDAVDKLTRINKWYAEQFAYLIGKLKAIPDGTGTLLDNTVVLWCNELGKGNSHTRNDAPYVLAGRAGGALQTGRFLSYTGTTPHNNLLVSLINAMGIPATTFGKPEWCTGPLARL